jgi:ubiquinone/menaquinone biosynthesis C-methylase UbiE
MAEVRFTDGASYDHMMGPWSRSVGELFLDWLDPAPGLDWIDVGCGSGAFTSLVVERCQPSTILGIDPSQAQLDYALQRGLPQTTRFEIADATSLPAVDRSIDVAVAALVVHFMRDPVAGVREMARVTKSGGVVAAYAWDLLTGGFPYDDLYSRMTLIGFPPPLPPSPAAGDMQQLLKTWEAAGLTDIKMHAFTVTRTFADFDDYWRTAAASPRIAAALEGIPPEPLAQLREHVRASVPYGEQSTVVPKASANAIVARA